MNKQLRVKCPQCNTEFFYYESEFRPFCTERCRQIDLGHWFKETYKVPEKEKTLTETDENEESEPENYEQGYEEDSGEYDEDDYE